MPYLQAFKVVLAKPASNTYNPASGGRMIAITAFILSVCGAMIHILFVTRKEEVRESSVEVFLLFFLTIAYGFAPFISGLEQLLFPREATSFSGITAAHPVLTQLGFAYLAWGITGLLCIWFRGDFWNMQGIGYSIFLLGSAFTSLREVLMNGAGSDWVAWLSVVVDALAPIIVISLLIVYNRRFGGPGQQELFVGG
jgi:hypothetical protein